jgi:hypothetical protein
MRLSALGALPGFTAWKKAGLFLKKNVSRRWEPGSLSATGVAQRREKFLGLAQIRVK